MLSDSEKPFSNETEAVLLFKMTDTEVFFRGKPPAAEIDAVSPARTTIRAFPMHWTASFGEEYYRQAQIRELLNFTNNKTWITTSEGIPYITEKLDVTTHSVLETEIGSIIDNIEKADDNHE